MSSVTPLVEERVRFGRDFSAEANAFLQRAAAVPAADDAESHLSAAARLSPDSLAVDLARYKFYFYRGQLAEAEEIVRLSLARAAAQGGFDGDWRAASLPLEGRWTAEGPARYFLYALKALAFIRLRRGARQETTAILWALARLDPEDLVGGSVIEDLLEGSAE